jgi:membrane-associated phospholipid phosphatase
MANILKLAVGRLRPRYFTADGSYLDTFVGGLPVVFGASVPHESGFQIQSFPSGHAATAVGLAIGLTWLYPRGRWLFVSVAVLAALQRIDVRAHYLSDTIAAAAVGCLGAALVMDPRVLGRWFDQFESKTPHRVASGEPHPVN